MNTTNSSPFNWPLRVYIEDTDMGGVVFYANYLKFFERARTEWLRKVDVSQSSLIDEFDTIFVVANVTVDYRLSAKLDDEIVIKSTVERMGRASLVFVQEAWRGTQLLAAGKVSVACVNAASFRPKPIPEPIRIKLQTMSA